MISSPYINMSKCKIIVMIPAFNESSSIAKVISEIPRKINGCNDIQVLVMDDNSTDNTSEVSKKAGADYVVRNKENLGLGKNFKKGIETSLKLGADIIVNIDADGQFNPKDIEKITLPIIHNQADMVTCSRFLNPELTKNMPWIKKWGNRRFTNLVSRITGQKFTDTQCGFRAYSREAALRLNIRGSFTYTQESFIDLVEKGMKILEVPCEVRYFKDRKSHISGKLRRYGFKSLGIIAKTTRDTQPLSFFGLPALIIFILGLAGGLSSLVFWLSTHTTTPIRTLFSVSVFLMIFGVSLGILALIADMLKSMKQTQDEVLYRLKKKDFEVD